MTSLTVDHILKFDLFMQMANVLLKAFCVGDCKMKLAVHFFYLSQNDPPPDTEPISVADEELKEEAMVCIEIMQIMPYVFVSYYTMCVSV